MPQLARANEEEGSQAQGAPDDIPALVLVNTSQKVGNTVLISNAWVVRVDNGLEGSAKIRRDVAITIAISDAISEDLAASAQFAVCGFNSSPGFDPAKDHKKFRGKHGSERAKAKPREDILFKASHDTLGMPWSPNMDS